MVSYESKPILETKALTKRFGGLTVLNGVNISVRRGDVTALIGPNGAGKTTFINVVTGFLSPDSGEVLFKGQNITRFSPSKIAEYGLIRTFQEPKPLDGLTLLENVMIGRFRVTKDMAQAKEDAREILESMGVREVNRPINKLTALEIRLLELARAVAAEPIMLLIDELFAGLNPKEVEEVIRILRKLKDRGITILLVEHVMKAVMSVSDRVVVLVQGQKIADGKPSEVVNNREVIEAYLGGEV